MMCADSRRALKQFLQHRNTIMSRMGDYVFEGKGLTATERRDRVKSLFNSLDMDGTVGAWRTRMGLVDGERTLAGLGGFGPGGLVRLPQGEWGPAEETCTGNG